VDLIYRSPFEGDTDLQCHVIDDGMWIWTYQGIAAAMPPMKAFWSPGLRNWYTARRDANLMGVCGLCGAEMPPIPVVVKKTVLGEMRHEDDCAIVSTAWSDEYARHLAVYRNALAQS
jgi:hypothetical protein